ncbi:UNVERIFIED_CONTAM: hypothetical protein FKN15_037448 [Acipenser sinensis]
MNLNNSERFFRGKHCSFLACSVEAKAVPRVRPPPPPPLPPRRRGKISLKAEVFSTACSAVSALMNPSTYQTTANHPSWWRKMEVSQKSQDVGKICVLIDLDETLVHSSFKAVKPLLPQIRSQDVGKICVLIDLDETLVHSSFKPVNNADFIIPVEIDGTVHQYADPVSDLLDKWGTFRSRLFRESCVFHRGNYVKDLSRLGRDLKKSIIIDNSPASYIFHPDNAVPVVSWFDDMSDTELLDLIPFFERLSKVDDVYTVLKQQRTIS